MTIYTTYRNGAGTLSERITTALAHFREIHDREPAALIVHPTEAKDAAALATVAVLASGGCLVGEVWLELPKPPNGDGEQQPGQMTLALGVQP